MEDVLLHSLKIYQFRNIETIHITPCRRFNVICGNNGEGKTNLLEAIYFLGALRSFRTSRREEVIRQGEEGASVEGSFGFETEKLVCRIKLEKKEKTVLIDGKKSVSTQDHYHKIPMVLFHPLTLGIIQGGPEGRRRLLDRALFQAEQNYVAVFQEYTRALKSKNLLLKTKKNSPTVMIYDEILAKTGAEIVEKRTQFAERLNPYFEEAFKEMNQDEKSDARVRYQPKVTGTAAEIYETIRNNLEDDIRKGYSDIGPHADDLKYSLRGKSAKQFASQGQQRMLALSTKIAETRVLENRTGKQPILLLDDISSELDKTRNTGLFQFLKKEGGQVFITTTHRDHISIDEDKQEYVMTSGSISD